MEKLEKMDNNKLREIFEETQKEFIENEAKDLEQIIKKYSDENGKMDLVSVLMAFHELSFNQSVGFMWEVTKKIEKYREEQEG